ncbi:hypothetical protein KEJ26_06240 [Candidatus Bathyarchaeota archaeon]|nr:hypothetical protein [Candidatus Bathyarchaeota archaeon]
MTVRVLVDPNQCARLAKRLNGVVIKPAKTLKIESDEDRENAIRLLFYYMAICHDTRGLEGSLDGVHRRGSDYLYYALKRQWDRNPDLFSPSSIAHLSIQEFRSWFSPDGNPKNCLIKRAEERARLLRDCGAKLLQYYGGRVTAIFDKSAGYLLRSNGKGLIDLLKIFEAYSDPLRKKIMVLLFLLYVEGLFQVKDPESLALGIDYHLQRIALRSGIISLKSPELAQKLKLRRFVTKTEESEIRLACLKAYNLIANISGIYPLDLDAVFWQIGRNCCHYDHPPICGGRPCVIRDCTLLRDIQYSCPGTCLFDDVCLASLDAERTKFFEPKIITFYY